jgi:crotonobetaine/carnitine-CoA ligase
VRWVPEAQETFPVILARMAKVDPDRPFARSVDGGSATWGQLHAAAAKWADRFVALGVRRGGVVGTIVDSSLDSLAMWLGLTAIGAIEATINSEFRGRMLAYAVNTCRPATVVVAAPYLPHLEAAAAKLETVTQVLVTSAGDEDLGNSPPLGAISLNALTCEDGIANPYLITPQWHDIACVTFTSGTTGPSKAVMLPWGQLNCINLATFPFDDLDATDVFLCFTAHAHFGSKALPYLAAMTGGQVVIRPRFSLSSFWDDIERFGVTTASLVGTMADMLMQSPDSPSARTTLMNMFMAPLGPSYMQFAERYGARICTVYNSTENGVPICSGWNPANPRTVGRLRPGYPGFEVRIVDEHDRELPDGVPGECVVRSSVPWTMNAGYLNNPQATAAAWRNGWFHTGDALMRTADGDYVFVDRLKDVIRRRGENISSFEVEMDVKLNAEIAECAAIAVPAETSEDEILLFAVRRPGSTITPQDLCAELEGRMTRFMVPRYVEFVDSLPKTQATERIAKAELRTRGLGPQTWDRQRRTYRGET